jgi:hypothetical protein
MPTRKKEEAYGQGRAIQRREIEDVLIFCSESDSK